MPVRAAARGNDGSGDDEAQCGAADQAFPDRHASLVLQLQLTVVFTVYGRGRLDDDILQFLFLQVMQYIINLIGRIFAFVGDDK